MRQERQFPNRVVGTGLVNPDFVALARSLRAHGERVTCMDEFRPALRRVLAVAGAAVIELEIDSEAASPFQSLSQIRRSGPGH